LRYELRDAREPPFCTADDSCLTKKEAIRIRMFCA